MDKKSKMNHSKKIRLILIWLLFFGGCTPVFAKEFIKMDLVKKIESSGNPMAHNQKSGARGLYQITPICLKEWNQFHQKEQYELKDLFRMDVNEKIARWYLEVRIPQILKYFGKPVTTRNILISYNAGVDYVVKNRKLKKETVDYLIKYEKF